VFEIVEIAFAFSINFEINEKHRPHHIYLPFLCRCE